MKVMHITEIAGASLLSCALALAGCEPVYDDTTPPDSQTAPAVNDDTMPHDDSVDPDVAPGDAENDDDLTTDPNTP